MRDYRRFDIKTFDSPRCSRQAPTDTNTPQMNHTAFGKASLSKAVNKKKHKALNANIVVVISITQPLFFSLLPQERGRGVSARLKAPLLRVCVSTAFFQGLPSKFLCLLSLRAPAKQSRKATGLPRSLRSLAMTKIKYTSPHPFLNQKKTLFPLAFSEKTAKTSEDNQ